MSLILFLNKPGHFLLTDSALDKSAYRLTAGPVWLAILMLVCLGMTSQIAMASQRTITDVTGRQLNLPDEITGVILGEGRFLPAISVVNLKSPFKGIRAMTDDLRKFDPATWQAYLKKFPELGGIPIIGASNASSFSTEKALSLEANVAVFGIRGHGPGVRDKEIIRHLEAAGVTIVFIDFRHDPLKNTIHSVEILGEIFNQTANADRYKAFYHQALDAVTSRLKTAINKPKVFIHSRVGLREECCESMTDTMIGRLVATAGGDNIATEILPGSTGVVSLELLLKEQPDIYLATAIGSSQQPYESSMVALGQGVSEEMAEASLLKSLRDHRLGYLQAVTTRHAYGLWHHFYNSPMNVIAIQQLAKWFHPQLFQDLDPEQTLRHFFETFQPIPLQGQYWHRLEQAIVQQ